MQGSRARGRESLEIRRENFRGELATGQAGAPEGGMPGPESSLLKLQGTTIQQTIQERFMTTSSDGTGMITRILVIAAAILLLLLRTVRCMFFRV